jgi:glutaredoxin
LKETILVAAEGCPGCEELLKRVRREKIDVGVLDVTKSLEAARIVRDLGIVSVPTIVTVERTEQGTELCTLDEEEKGVRCVKGSEPSEESSDLGARQVSKNFMRKRLEFKSIINPISSVKRGKNARTEEVA